MKTHTSKNVFSNLPPHTPFAEMSSLRATRKKMRSALSCKLAVAPDSDEHLGNHSNHSNAVLEDVWTADQLLMNTDNSLRMMMNNVNNT